MKISPPFLPALAGEDFWRILLNRYFGLPLHVGEFTPNLAASQSRRIRLVRIFTKTRVAIVVSSIVSIPASPDSDHSFGVRILFTVSIHLEGMNRIFVEIHQWRKVPSRVRPHRLFVRNAGVNFNLAIVFIFTHSLYTRVAVADSAD